MVKLARLFLAIFLMMLMSGVLATGCSSRNTEPVPQVGKIAPDFQLTTLDGQKITLSMLRDKTVLLNFWASWCGPCRFEMPFIQEIYEDKALAEKRLMILAVDIGESEATVRDFVTANGLTFTVLLDSNEDTALRYNIRGIPTTFLIDSDSVIQDIKVGAFASKADIVSRLSKIIK